MRIKASSRLYEEIERSITRPAGRPSLKPKAFCYGFTCRAKSWMRSMRVIAKIEWHQGELFSPAGFIVTNPSAMAEKVVRFCNQRGNCEQCIDNVELNIRSSMLTDLSIADFEFTWAGRGGT